MAVKDEKTFNIALAFDEDLDIKLAFEKNIDINTRIVDADMSSGSILSGTTASWNVQRNLIAKARTLYIYMDHSSYIDDEGEEVWVPGCKVGDGTSYLIDLPFTDTIMVRHMNDETIHVTQAEKEFWNNKNRAIAEDENLILTIN